MVVEEHFISHVVSVRKHIVEAYEKLKSMERHEDNQSTYIDELEVNIVMDQY